MNARWGTQAIVERVATRFLGPLIERRVAQAVQVLDDEYWSQVGGGGGGRLDVDWWQRREGLDDALEAWRDNALARRIVALTSDYVVGSGVYVRSSVPWVQSFVEEFWKLNGMARRCYSWCDELTRAGELFVVVGTDEPSGASFVRAIPAQRIDAIETAAGDLERELRYHEVGSDGSVEGRWWPCYGVGEDAAQVMVHFAINRPVGCVRGEGDLGPILSWLKRYKDWLENRVRLNKFKTAFLWDVTIAGRPGAGADTTRKKRFAYKTPPEPGSIIVHDDNETWQAVSPKLEAWDAKDDGKAIRLMVAAGAGVPLHFMSEGESATRATAAEMGDPTFRHYRRRQLDFGALLEELVTVVVRRANARGRGKVFGDLGLKVTFPDITKADNVQLAQSALLIVRTLDMMAGRGWVTRDDAVAMAVRFAGDFVDVEAFLKHVHDEDPQPDPRGVAGGAGRPVGSAGAGGDSAAGEVGSRDPGEV